jgi:hypothetical protein
MDCFASNREASDYCRIFIAWLLRLYGFFGELRAFRGRIAKDWKLIDKIFTVFAKSGCKVARALTLRVMLATISYKSR